MFNVGPSGAAVGRRPRLDQPRDAKSVLRTAERNQRTTRQQQTVSGPNRAEVYDDCGLAATLCLRADSLKKISGGKMKTV